MTRNNLEKMGIEQAPEETQSLTDLPPKQLDYINPTEHIELPSGGRFYSEDNPASSGVVEIYEMTAKHEDILTDRTLLKQNLAIDRLISSLLVDKRIDISDLLVGDKKAILIAARTTAYGPEYNVNVTCPNCQTNQSHVFDLENDCKRRQGGSTDRFEVELTPENTVKLALPKSGVVVELKMPTTKDERFVHEANVKRKKHKLPLAGVLDSLKMLVRSFNGVTERSQIHKFVDNMPARDSRYLKMAIGEVFPDIGLELSVECTECEFRIQQEVALDAEFFWPKH